jgi:hypothetical protein
MLEKLEGYQNAHPTGVKVTWSICAALTAPTADGDVVYSGAVKPRLK